MFRHKASRKREMMARLLRNRLVLIYPQAEVRRRVNPRCENVSLEELLERVRYEPVRSVSLKTRDFEKKYPNKYHERQDLVSIEMGQPPQADQYQPGDLVWVKCYRCPYWPAIIVPDPVVRGQEIDSEGQKVNKKPRYVELNHDGKAVGYHIQFFGNALYHVWISEKLIEPFKGWNAWQDEIISELGKYERVAKQKAVVRKMGVCDNPKGNAKRKANWNLAVSEAEQAGKLDPIRRIELLTYQYVDKIEDVIEGETEE